MANTKILIIDDDEAWTRTLKRMLVGFDVVICDSTAQAWAHLAEGSFAAILSDVHMPDETGVELLLKMELNFPQWVGRTVFMTGGSLTSYELRTLLRSRRPILQKPFFVADLRAVLVELDAEARA